MFNGLDFIGFSDVKEWVRSGVNVEVLAMTLNRMMDAISKIDERIKELEEKDGE